MIDLFGAPYSVYLRSARLAMEEKGVAYRLTPVDVFAPGGPGQDYLDRQPFGKIPALQHGDFALYETGAILRYVDEAFEGPALQPEEPKARARLNQILSILDNYAYRSLVWGIYVERVAKTKNGSTADEIAIASAMGPARTAVTALETLKTPGPYLVGGHLTLADCHAAPMLHLFEQAEEGKVLLNAAPGLAAWLEAFRMRESFLATAPA